MKSLLLIVLSTVLFYMSIYLVDQRQVVVIKNLNGHLSIVNYGIHFALPVWQELSYIYINQQNHLLTLNQCVETKDHYCLNISSILSYQVIDPIQYYHLADQADILLNQQASALITAQIKTTTFIDLLQSGLKLILPINLAKLGLKINNIQLNQIEKINNNLVNTNSSKVINSESNNIIINAYLQAQTIKTQVEIFEASNYAKFDRSDYVFYDYYRRLEIYKNSAATKLEMPSLIQLYNHKIVN